MKCQRTTLETITPSHQRCELDVLEDIPIHSLPHRQHEQVKGSDDCCNGDEGSQLILRRGAAEDEDVAIVGQARGAGVGIVVELAGAALRGARTADQLDQED